MALLSSRACEIEILASETSRKHRKAVRDVEILESQLRMTRGEDLEHMPHREIEELARALEEGLGKVRGAHVEALKREATRHCCTICFGDEELFSFPCGHLACGACTARLRDRCHVCRKPFEKENARRLYL
jgi:hypothetical protein